MADQATKCWGMFEQEVWDNPYAMYAEVGRDGPVQKVTLYDGQAAWLVTGYDAVRRVLGDHRLSRDVRGYQQRYPDRPAMYPPVLASKRHVLNADPPDHDRLRSLVGRAFTPRRVEALRDRVQELTDGLLEAMPDHGKVDLVESFAFPLPLQVIYELLGIPTDGSHQLRDMVAGLMLNAYSPGCEQAALDASDRLDAYLAELLESKRRHPGDDILSALIAATDEEHGRLDEEELAAFVFALVIAGHETTLNLICNGMVALLEEPSEMERLRRDPSLMHRAVTELLRYDGPLHHALVRTALEDLELEGVPIAAGDLVVTNLATANRDPDHFTDPDRLDVCRDEASHVSFGHGIHYCLGAPLALQETEIALASLLRRYPTIRLAVPRSELHWRRSMNIRGIEALPLEVSIDAVV